MASNEREQEHEEESDDEYDLIPEPDANGDLHSKTLAQAERAAAARPGMNARLKDVIERLIARGRVRAAPAAGEEHFKGEPAGNWRVWRQINVRWVTGVQQLISVFAPDAAEEPPEPVEEDELQKFLWEKLPNPEDEGQKLDEKIPP